MYTIGQVAKRTGISAHTLRFYDKQGLLAFVDRSPSGIRRFKERDFEWLAIITCLKGTGMPIRQIRQFVEWCQQGDATLKERRQMFLDHQEAVEAKIAELQRYLERIKYKVWYYTTAVEAGTSAVHRMKREDCIKQLMDSGD